MIDAGSDSLVQALVDAFVAGGKVKPVLPEGRREEILAALTRLMVNRPMLKEIAEMLVVERLRLGVDELLMMIPVPELPVEAVAERGLSALDDGQLVNLAIDPVALACLSEFLEEAMAEDRAGDVWWRAVDRECEDMPKESPAMVQDAVRRIKAMEGGPESNAD
jgi:hypothetical protein